MKKTLIAKCYKCNKQKTFIGIDIIDILKQLDNTDWLDEPTHNGKIIWTCPKCIKDSVK